MAINFPDPSQQTTYVADSGVTYEFIDGVWKATTFAGLGDVRYVNSTGDDMSGNLTIATDKISLNTDGSASFAGTVDANALTVDGAAVDTSAEVDAKVATKTTEAYVNQQIAAIPPTDLSAYDTSAEVTAKVAALETSLTDGAPGALDTLNELAASLGDDSNFAGTVTNSLAGKADLSGATFTGDVTASAFIGDGSQLTGVGSETIISSTPPTPADYEVGTMWWNSDSTDTALYILYQDPTGPNGDAGGKYWIEAAPAPDSIGFDGTHTGDSTFTGNMTVTGTTTFAGNLFVGDNCSISGFNGSANFAGSDIQLLADGSAYFASNVGIGASNNTSYDTVGQTLLVADESSHAGITIRSGGSTPFGGIAFADGVSSQAEKRAGRILYQHDGDNMTFSTANSEALRIDGAGRVLLGTTIAGAAAGDNLTIEDSSNAGITIRSSAEAAGSILFEDTASDRGEIQYSHNGDFMRFKTAGTERMRIDADGSATFAGDVSLGQNLTGGYALKINAEGNSGNVGGIYLTTNPSSSAQVALLVRDLATNTDKVQISTDGSAEFAGGDVVITGSGNVKSGDPDNSAGSVLSPVGQNYARQDGAGSSVAAYSVQNGGTTVADTVARINYDGSASFASNVDIGEWKANNNTLEGARIYSVGAVQVNRTSTGASVLAGRLNGSVTSQILSDGSAEFNSFVNVGSNELAGDFNTYINAPIGDDYFIASKAPGSLSTSPILFGVKTDGSATFGVFPNSTAINQYQLYKYNASTQANIVCKKTDSLFNNYSAFEVHNNAGTITASITGGGSATFVGGWGNDNGVLIDTNGFNVRADSGRGLGIYSGGNSDINRTISLNGDGSATFGNSPVTFSFTSGYSGGLDLSKDGYSKFAVDTSGNLTSNGSAYFASNVGIGASIPKAKFDISGVGGTYGQTLHVGGWGNNIGAAASFVAENTLGADVIYFSTSAATVGKISISATSTSYITSSDYRLKENVTAVTDGITRLQQLKPSRFNFIADPDKTVDGFLAHEAQTVVPEAITGTKDEVDDEGNAVMQGIDQSKLVPLLTAALQEAIAKIETLEVEVAALKAS